MTMPLQTVHAALYDVLVMQHLFIRRDQWSPNMPDLIVLSTTGFHDAMQQRVYQS